ncbi:hypothetical protein PT277_07660 [Acetobacteraceae bacterium ESL0709]|nr:hypothetical protein [Acetobacteraceae bacterium ESL0697]MDF7678554.1 hypothetical protein [Acetobacteraceae bacterium ESL0709]
MTLRRFAVAALAIAAFGGQAALAQEAADAPKHHKGPHHAHKKGHGDKAHHKKDGAAQQAQGEEGKPAPDAMKSDMPAKAPEGAAPEAAPPAEAQ